MKSHDAISHSNPFSSSNPLASKDTPARLGVGSWIILLVLLSLLAATGFIVYVGWTLEDGRVPAAGYVAMALGVVFSIAVGCGLMALIFYSSRAGYDEPPVLIAPENKPQVPESSAERPKS